jgi:glc operon protein GlcG
MRRAALTRRPTKFFEEMVAAGRVGAWMIHGVFPIEGGLPILFEGEVVGGFAVSGLKSQLDIVLVEAGLQALAVHQER